ncbi:MAG: methyltransferase domain-containing protein [Anaerolineae bacterium]|nr:methyltransferase domain-containing protein [Anaerolineae bacterium]
MTLSALFENWRREAQEPFAGWNFSHLAGRMIEDQPPWDYMARAAALMDQAESVLDIDTGGGEKLLELREHWPNQVIVTEGYPPNITLAQQQLGPLGVLVVPMESTDFTLMPFRDQVFDLVLNRHGAFHAAECFRILKPGGTLLTKQVHGLWAQDLLAVFGATSQWPDSTPTKYTNYLQAAGFELVDVQDWQGGLRFMDVGAIVYYLKAVPWLVPGFTVEQYSAQLAGLQARLDAGESLTFEARTYLIEARKPA